MLFTLDPTLPICELGGGNTPMVRPRCRGGINLNVDVNNFNGPDGQPIVDVVCDFNEKLPIGDAEWSTVFSRFVIEHLSWRKVRDFVKEVYRILKPGGKTIIITANTEKQLEVIKKRSLGMKEALPDKPDDNFTAFSCILFGDQDYPANTHRNYMSMSIIQHLFQEVGFIDIVTAPYGDLQTDLILEARKPEESKIMHTNIFGTNVQTLELPNAIKEEHLSPLDTTPSTPPPVASVEVTETTHQEWYDLAYFDGTGVMGGYRGGYRDFPSHEITVQHVLTRKPESVLELGCSRGHVLKRLQDRGVNAYGMDFSRHAYQTRCCDQIKLHDICNTPWPFEDKQFDLCFSVNVLDHVPRQLLPKVVDEMRRVSKRGLHGMDFGPINNGDRTRLIAEGREWWTKALPKECEVKSSQELEAGDFPAEVYNGDGRIKLHLGSFTTMFHNGWVNIDQHDLEPYAQANGYKYLKHDLRKSLPYSPGVVDMIYTSHFLEHLTYQEGLSLLRDCRRVIRPYGVLRIVVPDSSKIMEAYHSNKWEDIDSINTECANSPTPAMKLNHMLYGGDHKALYDANTLLYQLAEAGWQGHVSSFRANLDHPHDGLRQMARECMDGLPAISLFVDAFPLIG